MWHENWDAFRTYRASQWLTSPHLITHKGMVVGNRIRFLGIASTEIESSARALGLVLDEDMLSRVRILAMHAKEILNKDLT